MLCGFFRVDIYMSGCPIILNVVLSDILLARQNLLFFLIISTSWPLLNE